VSRTIRRGDVVTSGRGELVSRVAGVRKDGRIVTDDLYLGRRFATRSTNHAAGYRKAKPGDHERAKRYAARFRGGE
jgi:hypothetical protein